MKKNAIAVLLSIVLTLGNVGVVPAYAADTPTINKEAEISEESPIEEDSAVEEEPASQDEIEFSGDTSETESENANKDSANAEQDDEESEKDSGQKAEEIDNEEEQEKGQLTPQDTDSDAVDSIEENEETSRSADSQIDEESAFFLGKEFRIEGSSEVISFQEANGEIIATWRKSNGYFSWPLYVTWDIPGKKFSQILSQYGASGYGLLSQNDISGATFKGVIRDDGKWNVSIYNAQGNRCVGNTFSLVDLNGSGSDLEDVLVLEEAISCDVGEKIAITGFFHTSSKQVNASIEVSDSNALLLSNKKVFSPDETGEEDTWFITADVSTRKIGNYELTLTANGITKSSAITVRSGDINTDSDGDGLCNSWELFGADLNGDGHIDVDLPRMGADPNVPDIFVEVDWMPGEKPRESALRIVYEQFKNHGINLHIDVGPDSIDFVTNKQWDYLSEGNSIPYSDVFKIGKKGNDWESTAESYFSKSRLSVFRYCLFVNKYDGDGNDGTSGYANNIPGQFFIVADPNSLTSKNDIAQAGTFMHELGHTLGLKHGGFDSINRKPNHLSIMNYLFQLTGLAGTNAVNYSEYILPAIDEGSINEINGVDPDEVTDGTGLGTKWYYYHLRRKAPVLALVVEPFLPDEYNDPHELGWISGNSIDFNFNGVLERNIREDLNNDGKITILSASINEWECLNYKAGEIGAGASINDESIVINMSDNPEDLEELTVDEAIELNLISNDIEELSDVNLPNNSENADGDISKCIITLSSTGVVYNGKELKPNVTIYDGEKQLISGTDYNITYTNNINAGTAKVTITGIGNYTGTIEKFFTIAPKEITPTIILSENSFTYSGNEQKPTVVVRDGNTVLSGADYSATYPENCINAGTYVINVALKGNYTGSGSASFIINKIPQTVTARPWTNVLGIHTTTGCTVSGIGRITFSSSDPSIVKVESDGWLEGCGDGTVIITVNASGDVNHLSGQTTFEMTSKSVYEVNWGPCGDNATWTYYNIGRVEINGTGTIEPVDNSSGSFLWDRYYVYDPVWDREKVNTVIINEGITGIGREMFSERHSGGGHWSDSPETVEIADSVKTISTYAFYNCRHLERVKIGAGLTTLGDYVFSYCPSLKEILVSSDNQHFTVVDGALYSKNQRELYKLPNDGRTEFVVSAETSTIKEDALGDLDFLQHLTIPKSVTEIKDFALDGSTTLSDIYYEGSASKWAAIAIGEHNDVLNNVEIHFAETDKSIKNCSVKLDKTEYVYDGKKKMPDVTVLDGSKELEEGVNYQLSYKNNINAGTATVTIVGTGDYIGSVSKNFTIKKAANTITAKSFTRTYSTKVQSFDLGVKIKKGTPTYKSNSKSVTVSKAGKVTIKAKFIGKATITITAPASTNYTATTKKITVTVIPTKTALSSVSSPSAGKMTVKWKKNAVGTGYQIQYSTSSKFTSPKYATITKNTTLTKTIGSLAKGKKYYVRIRTYKTVGSSKFYSGWSAAKAVTIKK